MLGRLAAEARDASKMLAQKTKGVEFFILGMHSYSKLQAFLASDNHWEKWLWDACLYLFGLS